jgi:hypothetical protein
VQETSVSNDLEREAQVVAFADAHDDVDESGCLRKLQGPFEPGMKASMVLSFLHGQVQEHRVLKPGRPLGIGRQRAATSDSAGSQFARQGNDPTVAGKKISAELHAFNQRVASSACVSNPATSSSKIRSAPERAAALGSGGEHVT